MKVDKVVVNASPLILLFKGGLADLLPGLFAEVVVPEAVWREVLAGGGSDEAALQIPATSWLRRMTIPAAVPEVVAWNLGDGECSGLARPPRGD